VPVINFASLFDDAGVGWRVIFTSRDACDLWMLAPGKRVRGVIIDMQSVWTRSSHGSGGLHGSKSVVSRADPTPG
jgi:hypothetical protein